MQLDKQHQADVGGLHDPVLKHWGFDSDRCSHCGKVNNEIAGLLLQCGRCKLAYYCSQKCFNDDLPIHKKQCTTGKLFGYAPDPTKAQKLPDPPKPPKCHEPIPRTKKKETSEIVEVDRAFVAVTEAKHVSEVCTNDDEPCGVFCSEVMNPDSEATVAADLDDDHLLAMSYDELTKEDINHLLVQLPGPIYPCRCKKHCRGIDSVGIPPNEQSWLCPSCHAHVSPLDIDVKLDDGGLMVPLTCPDCAASFTVPRIQINDATDAQCPKRPNRSVDKESSGRPIQSRRKGSSPPRLPARCPECDACIPLAAVESGTTDEAPRAPVRCPECDARITVPRLQINDATDAKCPMKPSRSVDEESKGRPLRYASEGGSPPRLPIRCPECDACISLPPVESGTTDEAPRAPVRCPECDARITVPRLQINDATDAKCPRRPSRSVDEESRGTPLRCTIEGGSPPRLPIRCPECDACISWPAVESGTTDETLGSPIRCPECDARITVPRLQINDAVDERAPRQPRQSIESQPPRMPTRCLGFDACIAPTETSKNSNRTLPKENNECDAAFTASSVHINDTVDKRLPGRPRRDPEQEEAFVYVQTGFRATFPCPRCQASIACPMHLSNGCYDAPKQPVRCPECDVMIIVPRIQINDAADERKPKKPPRSQEISPPKPPVRCPECDVTIKNPVNGKGDEAPMKPLRCPECDAVVTVPRFQINDTADGRALTKPNRASENETLDHVLATGETENRDGPPRMPMRCKDCKGFLTWSSSDLRKASPFANARSPPRELTQNNLNSHDSDDDSLQESITVSEDDDFDDRAMEGFLPYYEVILRKLEPVEKNPPRTYVPHWTIALRKVDPYRLHHSGTASGDVSNSSATISTVELRRTEIQKRNIGWEKPDWVTSPPLRKTDVGEVLHSCGKLEKGIKEIKNAEPKAVPEWATIGPRLRKTASIKASVS